MRSTIFTVAVLSTVSLLQNALAAPAIHSNAVAARDKSSTPPFYLSIHNPNRQTFAPEYLTQAGTVTPTTHTATLFVITNALGLATADPDSITTYLSAPADIHSTEWQMMPSFYEYATAFSLNTTEHGEVLTWENPAFEVPGDNKARFCQGRSGPGITVVLKGELSEDCEAVDLVAIRHKRV